MMHFERVRRWPIIPRWALVIVAGYLALVALCVGLAEKTGQPAPSLCMFRRVTGLPCVTCGTTRMVLDVAQGRITEACAHNPLMFFLLSGAALFVLLRLVLGVRPVWLTSARSRNLSTALLIAAILGNWLYLLRVF